MGLANLSITPALSIHSQIRYFECHLVLVTSRGKWIPCAKSPRRLNFFTVVPNTYGSPVWNFLYTDILALRVWSWLLDFLNICAPSDIRRRNTDKDTLINILCILCIIRRVGLDIKWVPDFESSLAHQLWIKRDLQQRVVWDGSVRNYRKEVAQRMHNICIRKAIH